MRRRMLGHTTAGAVLVATLGVGMHAAVATDGLVSPDRLMQPQNISQTFRDQAAHPEFMQMSAEAAATAATAEAAGDTSQTWRRQLDPYRHDWHLTRGEMHEVAFENRYGATLRGHLFLPRARGSHPGIVLAPGYDPANHNGAWPAYWPTAQRLAEEGYAVLTVNPQGTGGSEQFDPSDPADQEYCGGDGTEWWRQPQEGGLREEEECAGHHNPFSDDSTFGAGPYARSVLLGVDERNQNFDKLHGRFRPAWVFATIDAAHWLVSEANPWHSRVRGDRVGAIGHSAGADAAALAAAVDPVIAAAVSMDAWGGLAPYAPTGDPTLFFGATHVVGPYDVSPGHHRAVDNAEAYQAAGVATGVVVIDDSVHNDFIDVAEPADALYLTNNPLTRSVVMHYSLAWFDLHLKRDRSAMQRLTADVFDGSADRSSIGQGTWDPVDRTNVPYKIEGIPMSDLTGRRQPGFISVASRGSHR